MAADVRPPVAIRIMRPYATEDEYLEHELETLTRASITLVGAQPRAEGVVLRFELTLASGAVLLRGEGRVTGFKPNAYGGVGGLALRFTRVDTRSKALIDKAASLREKRRPSLRAPDSVSVLPARASTPAASPSSLSVAPARPSSLPPPPTRSSAPHATVNPSPSQPPAGAMNAIARGRRDEGRRPDRDELLGRLRARAKALHPSAIRNILTPRGSTSTS
ncbi:MAG: hypothetical protein ABSF69_04960 [Polyangiaceae bacterium]